MDTQWFLCDRVHIQEKEKGKRKGLGSSIINLRLHCVCATHNYWAKRKFLIAPATLRSMKSRSSRLTLRRVTHIVGRLLVMKWLDLKSTATRQPPIHNVWNHRSRSHSSFFSYLSFTWSRLLSFFLFLSVLDQVKTKRKQDCSPGIVIHISSSSLYLVRPAHIY